MHNIEKDEFEKKCSKPSVRSGEKQRKFFRRKSCTLVSNMAEEKIKKSI